MIYLDTSLLVGALTHEPRTAALQIWLADQDPEALFISDWGVTEFSAALSVKVRTEQLTALHRADALAVFTSLAERSFSVLPVSRDDFRAAAHFADQYATGLRAGDALHLAVASRHGLQIVSLHRGLVKAAVDLGVSACLI